MRQPKASSAITKLNGYCEMGMSKEALKLACEILASPRATDVEFQNSVLAILSMSDSPKRYRDAVEAAYARLSSAGRKRVGRTMLGFYVSQNDFATAERFVPARPSTYDELLFSMGTFLHLGHLNKAKKLVKLCENRLRVERDGHALNGLHDALADYYSRTGTWSKALEHWSQMRLDEPLGDNALVGMVEIRVADAIQTAIAGIKALDDYRKHRRGELDIQLPGNEVVIIKKARAKLESYVRSLGKVVPKQRRREFGI